MCMLVGMFINKISSWECFLFGLCKGLNLLFCFFILFCMCFLVGNLYVDFYMCRYVFLVFGFNLVMIYVELDFILKGKK